MIEIVYNKEKEAAVGNEEYFCIPRNIRQIGQAPSDSKIYIEDYAYTYLAQEGRKPDGVGRSAILLGKCNWKEGVSYIFIKSALFMEGLEVTGEHISLTDAVWGSVYEEMKAFFPGQEVVGWYLSLPGNAMKITDMIYRTHLNHFGGNDKVLFMSDAQEQEEGFFLYRNGHLERQQGYYIYYERNEAMQEYMLGKSPKDSIDAAGKVQDRAVKDFRKIIAKKNEAHETKKTNQFLYVASTGLVVLSLAMGVGFISQRMNRDTSAGSDRILNENDIIEETGATPGITGTASSGDIPGAAPEETPEAMQEEETMPEVSTAAPAETAAPSPAPPMGPAPAESGEAAGQEQTGTVTPAAEQTPGAAGTEQPAGDIHAEQTGGPAASKYTIREGDTLSKISLRYYGDLQNVTEICKLNDLTEEDIIYPGQTILLP